MSHTPRNHRFLVLNLAALVVGMLLLTAASVPLYRIFCQVTGFGGTTERAAQAPAHSIGREMTVTFNADVAPSLPWKFAPGQHSLKVKVGRPAHTFYVAQNLSDHAITARAVYNVVPFKAGAYFAKVQCFCFSNQTLAPGQKAIMPVLFYIDPAMMQDRDMDDVHIITLSYTFFPIKTKASKTH